LNFKNKVAFVTGTIKGIERATIVALSAFWAKVIATDIDSELQYSNKSSCEKTWNSRRNGINNYLASFG
jgi:NAD(P)-dependent dehydrogenase (short-subunit alcohol dehydrogenase family)